MFMQSAETIKMEFPIWLYNLKEDISESNNLAESHSEIVQKLSFMIVGFDASLQS